MPLFPSSTLKTLPILACLSAASSAALATEFVVTTGADEFDGICDSHCSLRDAVQAANTRPGADRILLDGTYLLTRSTTNGADEDDNQNGDLDIRDELVIRGQGEDRTEIRGEGMNDRIFEVLPDARLLLDRLKISGGLTPAYGGALENHGETVISRVTLSDNNTATIREDDFSSGGAIANFGRLGVFSSTLLRNQAYGDAHPAYGGALYNRGQLVVRDSLFEDNRAVSDGNEGIAGALYNIGQADIARSTFIDSWVPEAGQASTMLNDGAAVMKVANSTFSDNAALTPVILNLAISRGGRPRMELFNVTIVDNIGTGVGNGGELRIRNSIIAGNWGEDGEYGDSCWNFGDRYDYEAVGLLLGMNPGNCTADLYFEDSQTLTHLVHPLATEDGRTYVHALRPNSPALDAGIGSCINHDQRRQPRPQDGDGDGVAVCDLGAYEGSEPGR